MRETLAIAICVIVSLVLLSVGTRYVTGIWLFAAFHSLHIHLAVGCIIALLFALTLTRSPILLALLVPAILLAGHGFYMARQFAVVPAAEDADAPTFTLLSFNVLFDNHANAEAVTRLILNSNADVVNIMEARPLLDHLPALEKVYPYRLGCGVGTRNCDLLMLSKQPLRATAVRSLSRIFEERLMLAQVTLAGRTVHLGAIHTTKPYFDDFQTVELVRAALAIVNTQGALVLSGDFNATSIAPNMRMFLRWTGLRTAAGEPATWPIAAGRLGIPIDHVYVRAPLKIKSLTRLPDALGSNHFGLIAEIAITNP